MISKPLLAASAALAGLLSFSTMSLATEQGTASKPGTRHAQAGPADLAFDLDTHRPNPRLADKLIDVSDRAKQEDARYRASGT
ncbi:MAG: hypothetical protein JJ908_13140 [Rhizobiales bacterium]|nr:hypothetical protein [Hyphomicrobiales bacterium]MBO6699770.1 hypothetical protein [Hyphomicrobiales bacterium]MBO6737308.1 hypothetical protein [Hyphomicrobiales bacterium]MBO6911618.1 hypothetical protein [Hyphomicrobiales bacterium]MBO6954960.1 hypothetical protein [Hyphomicrobiales bacterium]